MTVRSDFSAAVRCSWFRSAARGTGIRCAANHAFVAGFAVFTGHHGYTYDRRDGDGWVLPHPLAFPLPRIFTRIQHMLDRNARFPEFAGSDGVPGQSEQSFLLTVARELRRRRPSLLLGCWRLPAARPPLPRRAPRRGLP